MHVARAQDEQPRTLGQQQILGRGCAQHRREVLVVLTVVVVDEEQSADVRRHVAMHVEVPPALALLCAGDLLREAGNGPLQGRGSDGALCVALQVAMNERPALRIRLVVVEDHIRRMRVDSMKDLVLTGPVLIFGADLCPEEF